MDKKLAISAVALVIMMTPSLADDGTNIKPVISFEPSDAKFMGEDERLAWLNEMRSTLPIVKRKKGPFGFIQDTSAVAVVKKVVPQRSDAFLNVIKEIKVTALLPSDDKFVIGSREFLEGQALEIIREKRQFNVQIVSVSIDSILFKNMDTGEVVKKNMITLPNGMTRNGTIGSLKGITRTAKGKPAPLNLDQ